MKINLASGQRPFPKPWLNVDAIEQNDQKTGQPYILDFKTDVKDLSMIPDNSVDIMIAHHLVEHIAIHDLDTYIAEWYKKLKVGGIMSIFVPNLRELDRAWVNGTIDTYIHNVNTYGAWQGDIMDLHKWGYDYQELVDRLSGWDGTNKKFNWSQIRTLTPDRYLSDPVYQGSECAFDWWILSVEFVK